MRRTAREQGIVRVGRRAELALKEVREGRQPQASHPALSVATKTAAYTLSDGDDVVRGDTAGGGFTLTLPPAIGRSRPYYIRKVDAANVLTVASTGSDTVNGAASVALNALGESLILIPVSGGYESF